MDENRRDVCGLEQKVDQIARCVVDVLADDGGRALDGLMELTSADEESIDAGF